ncbi:6-carboxytetrahydropterin synthase QueD [Thermosulfuriphilus ammonigenes]|uniref:6-carboxy-5,6,7,8-tetrahydropterin synthase n=1 Tax=Thermosulfuriphilus ammonigenes TaxID=1936021 RepID=A0A6G7PY34_9BACT|nr:6-carboxytetrahydropterin synthase QueD [Thermosulfuriphilus ammonigenes]MBA2849507.1 6-pyruvoyltetrahydropterin/6-carboxytetrahydropterin synthase [Thermosulfuriphilus ammonigenes]QIJ72572.1 6-carboxytetrahydropterin synthase QueD [Thermosulfuriphilus ammonigenes]
MFEIKIRDDFSAAHHLRDYPGNCERPHGHNWSVEVAVFCERLDSLGMGIDFREVKGALKEVLRELDHHNLNEIPPFAQRNPSSENIAVYIFEEMARRIDRPGIKISAVTVCETPRSCVTYYGPKS